MGLHLITCSTPNGKKVHILLEELKDVYGLKWTTSLIDIDTDEQKKPWFLLLSPNGTKSSFGAWDSMLSSIYSILQGESPFSLITPDNNLSRSWSHQQNCSIAWRQRTKINTFSFSDDKEQSQMMQWLIFWHSSGQPNQGQLNHFGRFPSEQIPYAIERFKAETPRFYNVLELHLSGRLTGEPREHLAGNGLGKFSIANINAHPWVRAWKRSKISEKEMEKYPHLREWIDRVGSRPAVQRGTSEIYDEEVHPELLVNIGGE